MKSEERNTNYISSLLWSGFHFMTTIKLATATASEMFFSVKA